MSQTQAEHGEAYTAYKKLITNIADALQPDDISKLAYQEDISVGSNQPALDLLKQLERGGKIGPTKIQNLIDALDNIHRSDLIESKIKPFVKKFPQSTIHQRSNSSTEYVSLPSAHSDLMAPNIPPSREPLSLPSQESSSYQPGIHTEPLHQPAAISASASFASFSGYCEPITEEELPIESSDEQQNSSMTYRYTSLPGDLNHLKPPNLFKKSMETGGTAVTVGFDKPQISTPEESRRHYTSRPLPPLHSYHTHNSVHTDQSASFKPARVTYPPHRYKRNNGNSSIASRRLPSQCSTRENDCISRHMYGIADSQATLSVNLQRLPNRRKPEQSPAVRLTGCEETIANRTCDKSLTEFPMEGENTSAPIPSDQLHFQEQDASDRKSLTSGKQNTAAPYPCTISSTFVGVTGSHVLPTLDTVSDRDLLHRGAATTGVHDVFDSSAASMCSQEMTYGVSLQPDIQAPSTQGKQLKNSLKWKVKCKTMIEQVRKKKTNPLKETFHLSVGCKYGRKIKVRLLLFPFESTNKRYISLQAIISIPKKCSQRRWLVQTCQCSYRLSIDVTNPSNSLRIVEPQTKQVKVALSEVYEEHCTHIDFSNVLPHDEILYQDTLCFFITLELLINGYSPCTDNYKSVAMKDNDSGFLEIFEV